MNAIDVIGSKLALGEMFEAGRPGETVGMIEMSWFACGGASRAAVEMYGRDWLETLIQTAELGGVGRLERAPGGAVFRFVAKPPGVDEAVTRALDAIAA
jgi:hypothetical protein